MIEQNVTENPKQPNTQKMSRYAKAYGTAMALILKLLFALYAGFAGLGIYQFMVMVGLVPAS